MATTTKVLVLGATGMLGNAVFRLFSASPGYRVVGAVRSQGALHLFPASLHDSLISGIDAGDLDSITHLVASERPDVVINCIGVVKQRADANDVLATVPLNSLLPHRLARLCDLIGARLVQISTDCVFSGHKGGYSEGDFPDAYDLYGRSKLMGEVDYAHAITLRTSIVGPELAGQQSLLGWFLAQQGSVLGYQHAIFSGLPTVELARVIRDCVIPRPALRGVYHVSAQPISKLALLELIAREYGKSISIFPDQQLVIDRSLDSSRFRLATGYQSKPWDILVRQMFEFG